VLIIDVRDLSEWMIRLCEQETVGAHCSITTLVPQGSNPTFVPA
jgi:hypothetical protein